MSLLAMVWAAELPANACSGTAFRVLLKYADHADSDGCGAYISESRLADTLQVSERTIRRARRELVDAGLLAPGDQRRVEHMTYKPRVYDVMTPAALDARRVEGRSTEELAA